MQRKPLVRNAGLLLGMLAGASAFSGCTTAAEEPGGAAGTMVMPTAGTTAGMLATGGAGAGGTVATGGAGGTVATGGAGGIAASGGEGGMVATGGVGGAMTGGMGGESGMGAPTTACSAPTQNAMVGNACAGGAPPALKLTQIVNGLQSPTYVTQAPGDDTRLYVLEQSGTIKIVKDGAVSGTLLDLGSMVNAAGVSFINYYEAGLLGMTFDPAFETTHRFWLSYSRGSGIEMVVMEYEMTNPDMVDPASGTQVIVVPQKSFNHKGGMLAFGPDGCLWFGTGDGGNEGDPSGTGQGTNDELSVMLRIDVDNPSTPAPGNLAGNIWSTGLRNPWRFSFDRMTGDLYIGDVGQDSGSGFEEVNVEPKGVGGRNYGWSVAEGKTRCTGDCSMMTPPADEYPVTASANSVIGGYVYRGTAIPGMVGRYIYADWTERKLKTFIFSGEADGEPTICDKFDTGITASAKVRSFGEDNAGELYVLTGGMPMNGLAGASLTEAGTLYRIDAM